MDLVVVDNYPEHKYNHIHRMLYGMRKRNDLVQLNIS